MFYYFKVSEKSTRAKLAIFIIEKAKNKTEPCIADRVSCLRWNFLVPSHQNRNSKPDPNRECGEKLRKRKMKGVLKKEGDQPFLVWIENQA